LKAADYIVSHEGRTEDMPSTEDVRIYCTRAKLEGQCLESNKEEWLEELESKQRLKPDDFLTAHIYADRVSTIEGKHFEQWMRQGKTPTRMAQFSEVALEEYEQNKEKFEKAMAHVTEAGEKDPQRFAILLSQAIIHEEKYGVAPTEKQQEHFQKIADYLEQRKPQLNEQLKNIPEHTATIIKEFTQFQERKILSQKLISGQGFPKQQQLQAIQHQITQQARQKLKEGQLSLGQHKSKDRGMEL